LGIRFRRGGGVQDAGYWDAGYRIQDTGEGMLEMGYKKRMLDTRYWRWDTG